MRYDLHIHSKYSKPCGHMEPSTILKIAKKRGLDGIAVTDHNTIKGALLAKKLNKDKDFEVIIGEEVSTQYGDVLLHYVQEEIKTRDLFEVLDKAKQQDCIVVIPHAWRWWPLFKVFSYPIDKISSKIHAIETFNGRNFFWMNWLAKREAEKFKLAKIAGSDSHIGMEIGRVYNSFNGSLREAIKNREIKIHGTTFYGLISGVDWFIKKNLKKF